MKYPIALHSDDGIKFSVSVPDLPGCFSAGDTLDEAIENAREGIVAHLEFLAEDGDPIPAAGALAEHRQAPEFADAIWAVVEVDIAPFLGKSDKINITLPRLLIHQIDRYVLEHKIDAGSRSGFLAQAALKALSSPRTPPE